MEENSGSEHSQRQPRRIINYAFLNNVHFDQTQFVDAEEMFRALNVQHGAENEDSSSETLGSTGSESHIEIVEAQNISLLVGFRGNDLGDGPLQIAGFLADTPVMILIDSGSDYNCIDREFAQRLRNEGCTALLEELPLQGSVRVPAGSAFVDAQARAPVGCAKWRIAVYGSYTFQGKSQMHLIEVEITE